MGVLTLPWRFGRCTASYAQYPSQWGQSCRVHGLEYTTVNPPKELTEAVEQAIEELIEAQADEIQYFLED